MRYNGHLERRTKAKADRVVSMCGVLALSQQSRARNRSSPHHRLLGCDLGQLVARYRRF
jgi:hypothetical protein